MFPLLKHDVVISERNTVPRWSASGKTLHIETMKIGVRQDQKKFEIPGQPLSGIGACGRIFSFFL